MNDVPDCFRRIQAGDHQAFADLIATCTPVVRGYVRCRCQPHEVETVVQEVWVRLWQRAGGLWFDDRRRLEAWLLRTARLVALELWSQSSSTGRRGVPIDAASEIDPGAEEVDTKDDRQAVRQAIYRLDRDDQVLFYLACFLDWSHDQIVASDLLEVRDAAQSRQRLFQARQQLILELRRTVPQLAERLFGPA